jgi:hypothetical protein
LIQLLELDSNIDATDLEGMQGALFFLGNRKPDERTPLMFDLNQRQQHLATTVIEASHIRKPG